MPPVLPQKEMLKILVPVSFWHRHQASQSWVSGVSHTGLAWGRKIKSIDSIINQHQKPHDTQ